MTAAAVGVHGSAASAADFGEGGGQLTVRKIDPPKDLLQHIGANALPSDVVCYSWDNAVGKVGESCFEYGGDDQWVRDTQDNGMGFRVHVRTTYDKDRYCYASGGSWTECKYDHKENSCVKWHGYHPPHATAPEPWTKYHKVSNGDVCG